LTHLDLGPAGAQLLLGSLRAQADAAAVRLGEATRHHLERSESGWCAERPHDVAVAVHRMLTRSRFLKVSRSCFPPDLAIAKIGPFVEQRLPVTLMVSGFPFKQHDNGLKAAGRIPTSPSSARWCGCGNCTGRSPCSTRPGCG
jgi:hypothetical protein